MQLNSEERLGWSWNHFSFLSATAVYFKHCFDHKTVLCAKDKLYVLFMRQVRSFWSA